MRVSIEIIFIVVAIGLYIGFIQPSTDALLVLCAIGIYILDSSVTLYANEFVILESSGKWRAIFPSTRWRVLRKMLTILHPLTPNVLAFKGYWATNGYDTHEEDIDGFIAAMKPLRIMAIISFILVFLCIPIAIFLLRDDVLILALIIVLYLNALISLIIVWMNRRALHISNRFFFKLTIDSFLCIPLVINLARKISLNYQWNKDILQFSKEKFCSNEYIHFVDKLIDKVEIAIKAVDKNTDKYNELVRYKEILEANIG